MLQDDYVLERKTQTHNTVLGSYYEPNITLDYVIKIHLFKYLFNQSLCQVNVYITVDKMVSLLLNKLVFWGRQANKHENSTEYGKCFNRVIPRFNGNIEEGDNIWFVRMCVCVCGGECVRKFGVGSVVKRRNKSMCTAGKQRAVCFIQDISRNPYNNSIRQGFCR